MSEKRAVTMDKLVSLCKNRGFIFPGSEIYGGLANSWDYGPLGVELKNNVKKAWWKKFVQENPYNTGVAPPCRRSRGKIRRKAQSQNLGGRHGFRRIAGVRIGA